MTRVTRWGMIGGVGWLLLVGCGESNEAEVSLSCGDSPTGPLNAVMSDIPTSGDAPLILTLDGRGSASGEDACIRSYDWHIAPAYLPDGPGPYTVALPPGNHGIKLCVVDANGDSDCVEEMVTVAVGDGSEYGLNVVDDRIITLDTTELENALDLETEDYLIRGQLIQHVSWVLHTHFQDDFDFLVLMFNRTYERRQVIGNDRPLANYHTVQNFITGLGPDSSIHDHTSRYGSEGRLQGVALIGGRYGFETGSVLHEIMHRWGNRMIPTADKPQWRAHWGFSSVYGQLGGFDQHFLQRVPRHDNAHGQAYEITDGGFSPYNARVSVGLGRYVTIFSPLELYLMGLVPLDDVPTIRAAADAEPVVGFEGRHMHTVARWEVYDQARILREFGRRNPPYGEAQTEFKAAVVLMTNVVHPATEQQLRELSGEVDRFGLRSNANWEAETSFWEATGGRASMETGRLSLSRKAVPTPPNPTPPSAEFERLYGGNAGTIPPIH